MSDGDINGGKVRAVGHCQYTYRARKVFPPFFFYCSETEALGL